MILKDDRHRADSILNDFWQGVSDVFKHGPLKNLDSFDILYEQSPKAMTRFMNTQLNLHQDMTFKELDESLHQMKDAFQVVVLRYKNMVRSQDSSVFVEEKKSPVIEEKDPFAEEVKTVSLDSEDPFA